MWWSVSGCFVCFSASSKQKNSQMFFFFTYSSIHAHTVHCKNNHSVVLLVKIELPLSVRSCLIKFMEAACINPHSCRVENCTEHKDALAGFLHVISLSSPVSSPFWLNPLSSTGVFWWGGGHRCPDVSPQQDYEQTPQQRRVNGNTRARSLTKSNSNRSSHVVKQVHDYAPYAHIPCAHRQMCDSDVCVLVLTVQTQTQLCHEHLL